MMIDKVAMFNQDGLLFHLVAHAVTVTLQDKCDAFIDSWKDKAQLDIRLTVEGQELDLESFMKNWQENVEREVSAQALQLFEDKLYQLQAGIGDVLSTARRKAEAIIQEVDQVRVFEPSGKHVTTCKDIADRLAAMPDEQVKAIWDALRGHQYSAHDIYEGTVTWDDWVEQVYCEHSKRGLRGL